MTVKVGRDAIDPSGRRVRVVDVEPDPSGNPAADTMIVRQAGPYAATARYARSSLAPAPDDGERFTRGRVGRYIG